jgi:DNA-binding NarL/FixJ family response regulator
MSGQALVVSRHRLFGESVKVALERLGFEVSVATSRRSAVAIARSVPPLLVLIDLSLDFKDGEHLARVIRARHPDATLIGVTTSTGVPDQKSAQEAGFRGIVTKGTSLPRFAGAVRAALSGRSFSDQEQVRRGLPVRGADARHAALLARQLTPREWEVLELLVDGASGSRIAQQLGVSPNTVRTHIQSILTKLQVHSRLEAAGFAVRNGLVASPGPAPETGAAWS